ncbi:MAG: hypothetical protein H7A37_02280 [Chlamydiales bacterium]|nr:hypothetical protein [Chlamydiia bacterium]MCP5507116.1 hypothetical protein [Chlamydiales bacterium]
MDYFYFDTGLHRFLSKQHDSSDQKRQVNDLILSLRDISGIDLYSGFKPVWAPGLYLERIHLGSKLLKGIIEKTSHTEVTDPLNDNQVDDLFTRIRDNVDKIVDAILEKHLPLPCVPSNMIGYVGGILVEDLNDRYSDDEKELLTSVCLKAEATQQVLLNKLKGTSNNKASFQKIVFHSCIKGFFQEYFSIKRDINLSRLMLTYSSIAKGIEKNSKPGRNGEEKRLIDPNKDIADGELIHLATFGTWVNGELAPVNAVTFDSLSEIRNRLRALKSISAWVSANQEESFPFQWGKVYCVDESSHEISVITVEELDLEPWVFISSSDDALALLRHEKVDHTT